MSSPRSSFRRIIAPLAGLALAATAVLPLQGATAMRIDTQAGTQQHGPKVGSSLWPNKGETNAAAFDRIRRTYGGRLGAVRLFYPGKPLHWSGITSIIHKTPAVVSFKFAPGEIIAGTHDAYMRQWFRQAPQGRATYWSYWHEPEDDIERGQLNSSMYKQAWRHLEALADSTGNSKLRATLTLMYWTCNPNSHRSLSQYYPGGSVIDVMAYDVYNSGHQNDVYRPPYEMLRPCQRQAHRVGKPWGVAELGSVLVGNDSGPGRARWLRNAAAWTRRHHGRFLTYFNSDIGVDYRLHDTPSRTAWRDITEVQFR